MENPALERSLRIAICDDDPRFLERLQSITQQTLGGYELSIVAVSEPQKLMDSLQCFQLAILDIQYENDPSLDGILLSRRLTERSPLCRILFVSGYTHYVSLVYDVPHLCLVLKDQAEEMLPRFLLKAAGAVLQPGNRPLTLIGHGTVQQVPQEDVCYIERRGHSTYVICRGNRQLIDPDKLDRMAERLSSVCFCRCHVSYLVNFRHVLRYDHKQFQMDDGTIIPISRNHAKEARERFAAYLTDQE